MTERPYECVFSRNYPLGHCGHGVCKWMRDGQPTPADPHHIDDSEADSLRASRERIALLERASHIAQMSNFKGGHKRPTETAALLADIEEYRRAFLDSPHGGPPMTLGEIVEAEERTHDHPEDRCDECGRENCVWWVASDRWNIAMGRKPGGGNNPVLCPVCFISRWEESTGLTAMWEMRPDDRTIKARR